jgi:pyruvate,orthophosphate dikinase
MTFVFPIDHPHAGPPEAVTALLGGKAANLGAMARDLGLPVPPGFVITTEACHAQLGGGWPEGLDAELHVAMGAVERQLGREFGGPGEPLLVSVRSGAPVSMPGMLDTVLDIGATSATAAGLAAFGGPAFAADCRTRLERMFRDVVARGDPPDDAWGQLGLAIKAVFASWTGDRARAYRRKEGIPDDLGTAVTVQAMVFGNRDERSATGVLFTRDPATGERRRYGDVLFGAQGEDVVAGGRRTEPITALDERLPDVARELAAHAELLERHFADLCDIEFTVESGRLWLLQVRVGKRSPQAALRIAVDMAEDPDFPLTRAAAVRRVEGLLDPPPLLRTRRDPAAKPIAVGLPASPGVAVGEIVVSPDEAVRRADAGGTVILVRAETSPEDVHGMARAAGILTATGGIASHAAVVARGWGIPAVVGVTGLRMTPDGIELAGRSIAIGETLTIDGGSGEVFTGTIETSTEPVPAAATLLGWARELGIQIGGEPADAASSGKADAPAGPAATPEDCLRVLAIKGMATIEGVAAATGTSPAAVRPAIDRLLGEASIEMAVGSYRLTADGRRRSAELLERERAAVGTDVAANWLDAFLDLDGEVKQTVTAWQLRPAGESAEPVPNDHADAMYDAAVLERLARVAGAADALLRDVAATSSRFEIYRQRLASAAAAATAGDGRFVASPRVDSVHGVWFELHEELIRLAGRTRESEAEAGRA